MEKKLQKMYSIYYNLLIDKNVKIFELHTKYGAIFFE